MSVLAAPTTLAVSLQVTPAITEPGKAPQLEVLLRNQSQQAVTFMDFPAAGCFAHFYLKLSLTAPAGHHEPQPVCAIRRWPGSQKTLQGGEEYRRALTLSELFPQLTWPEGKYELAARWDATPLRSYMDGKFAWKPVSETHSGLKFNVAKVLTKLRIEKGGKVVLPDGTALQFAGHSHRSARTNGPPSKLILFGTLTASDEPKATEFSVSIDTDYRLFFILDRFAFELLGHEYDQYMELKYFGVLTPWL